MARKSKVSPANDALATAQLIQFLAVGVVIAGVALIVLGRQQVIADWLGLLLGLPVAGRGGLLLWRDSARAAEAGLLVKQERPRKRSEPADETKSRG